MQYKTLLKDDLTAPLREIVAADKVRPVPPEIPVTVFGMYDKVDAFDNDGWWVGKITGKIEGMYYVYFETTKDEVKYPLNRLRVHQDWVDGKWVSSYNNRVFNLSYFLSISYTFLEEYVFLFAVYLIGFIFKVISLFVSAYCF